MPQTTISQSPAVARPGQLADAQHAPDAIRTAYVDAVAGIAPGLVVLRTSSGDDSAGHPAITADPDAIIATIGSTAGTQTPALDGATGAGRIYPAALIDLVLDSSADWDATSATLSGLDQNGLPISETLTIPDAGNDTVTSTLYYSRVTELSIPAQSGTGGSATLGVSASRTLAGGDVLGVSVHSHKALLDPSNSNNEVYEDECEMPVLREGCIRVAPETTHVAGDVVFVRLVAAGAEVFGAVRTGDSDGGDCVAWPKGRLLTSGAAGALSVLEVTR